MGNNQSNKIRKCEICKKDFPYSKLFPIKLIRNSILDTLRKKYPDINKEGFICYPDLRDIRAVHVEGLLTGDRGALSQIEKEVVESLAGQDILTENVNKKFERKLSFGERMANRVAHFGGSWRFILSFLFLILAWMAINSIYFLNEVFDPFPFH